MGAAEAPRRVESGPASGAGASERIYAGLLRVYPRAFRDRYGAEMALLFSDQLRDARAAGGTASLWIRVLRDLASTALAERLHAEGPAQSLGTFEPTRSMRLFGLLGLVGGLLLLWAFVAVNPFEARVANMARLITFAIGGATIAVAFYGRQASVARTLALVSSTTVVISGVVNAGWTLVAMWVPSPFSGLFGTVGFWSSLALWLSAGFYGVAMLRIGAAWRGMDRSLAVATRLGAIALLGSLVAWVGIDRIGLVHSEPYGQQWQALALIGIFLTGMGWVLLGAVLTLGNRRARRHAA